MKDLLEKFLNILDEENCVADCPKCNYENHISEDLLNVTQYQLCRNCKNFKFEIKKCSCSDCDKYFIYRLHNKCIRHREKVFLDLNVVNDYLLKIYLINNSDSIKIEDNNCYKTPVIINQSHQSHQSNQSNQSNQKQQNNAVTGLCEGITASKGTPCGKPSKFVTESGKRACGFHKNKI